MQAPLGMRRYGVFVIGVVAVIPAAARAQEEEVEPPAALTVEAMGGWGVQAGNTEYPPDGSPTEYRYPFTSGWSVGATVGWLLLPDVALIGSYEYRTSSTVEGDIMGVVDRVQGFVSYHTAVVGLRLYRTLGPGRLRADMGAGLVFPFETRTEYDWGPGLAAAGITGTGTTTDEYALGYGVAGQLGYEIPVGGPAFVGLGLGLRVFQSTNDGKQTTLENMVTDFAAMPPTAVDATIDYGDGDEQPTTYSVQDVTWRVSVGARF